MPKAPANLRDFSSLLKVVEALRGPDGCPWDKEQTHQSLTRYAIEEAYELAEAIDTGSEKGLVEELGDVLLQVVLHAEIARQEGRFDIHDVIEGLNNKMIRRHPHVFGDTKVNGSKEVLANWAEIKAKENPHKMEDDPFPFPKNLPPLLMAQKMGEKVDEYGMDWDSLRLVWEQASRDFHDLEYELNSIGTCRKIKKNGCDHEAQLERVEADFGDILFTLVHLARYAGISAENALRKSNRRFEKRFKLVIDQILASGRKWEEVPKKEKEELYLKIKKAEKEARRQAAFRSEQPDHTAS